MPKTIQEWLQDPGLFATSALALFTDRFGIDFVQWDPLTLRMEVSADFGVEMSTPLQDRVQAACALLTSNLFFVSLETFNTVCNALNFGVATNEVFLPSDLDDVLWGVSEARILMGDDFQDTEFSHNVRLYTGCLLSQSGIRRPPSMLAFAEYPEREAANEESQLQEDPLFAKVNYDQQQTLKQELEADNNVRILLLFRQLAGLPLKQGDVGFIQDVIGRLRGSVQTPLRQQLQSQIAS